MLGSSRRPTSIAVLTSGGDAAGMNAAVRADPSFVPTRYFSTRTAVRSGRVLRALCVYDWIFGNRSREMQVLPNDLPGLRLNLLLSGPLLGEAAGRDLEALACYERVVELLPDEDAQLVAQLRS